MGHVRLGRLPKNAQWNEVVRLLAEGAGVDAIARASAKAAQDGFDAARNDAGLLETFYLLTILPSAARDSSYADALREDLDLDATPSLLTLASRFASAVDDRMAEERTRSDIGEMAVLAAVQTIVEVVGNELPQLFEPEPRDLERALATFATERRFGVLARGFFTRFTERYLRFYLDRAIASHVGPHRRLPTASDRQRFDDALRRHCFETARIVETFAGEWMSKHRWQGGITREKARGFIGHAFTKLGTDLRDGEVVRGG